MLGFHPMHCRVGSRRTRHVYSPRRPQSDSRTPDGSARGHRRGECDPPSGQSRRQPRVLTFTPDRQGVDSPDENTRRLGVGVHDLDRGIRAARRREIISAGSSLRSTMSIFSHLTRS